MQAYSKYTASIQQGPLIRTHQLRSMLLLEKKASLVLDTLSGGHSVTDVSKLSVNVGGACNSSCNESDSCTKRLIKVQSKDNFSITTFGHSAAFATTIIKAALTQEMQLLTLPSI